MRRARAFRRLGIGILAVVVLLGLANLLGVRSRTVSASASGYDLRVTYAAVTRPGLATGWEATVHHEGGFDDRIGLATTATYFDGFDFHQIYPEPASTTVWGGSILMTFEPPRGDVLHVRLDARATPAFHLGNPARTELLVGGVPVLGVTYRTTVLP